VKYFYPNYFYKKKTLKFINKTLNIRNYLLLKKKFIEKKEEFKNSIININNKEGFVFLNKKNALPENLLRNLENFCTERRISEIQNENNDKNFMINLLKENDVQKIDGLLDFSLNKNIVNIASNYLNTIPFLAYIYLFYSFPNNSVNSSQLFHCDTEDDSQLKLFFYLDDVDDNNGPFVFIPKNKSLEIMRKTKYQGKRLTDNQVYEHINRNEVIKFTGKKGSGLAIDTCGCLHYGSRENVKPRKLLMIQFTNHFASLYYKSELSNFIDLSSLDKDKLINCMPQKKIF
tara:strand:+ start:3108 stop:3971 length:864 start_codon:yes stop_codon:yes gene_type:complete